jgi:Holliday junction resolvase-like predicted endonuclease
LINCFDQKEIKNYWFESGTPTFLFHQMQRFGTDITKMDEIRASETAFYLPTETLTDALPLLYQAGYLTIKDYDRDLGDYTLGIPNDEVRIGLTEGLLPYYAGLKGNSVRQGGARKMWLALRDGDIDRCLGELKAFLAGVPYVEGFKKKLSEAATKEGFYEYTFYLILSMLNVYVQTQVRCSTGRVDMIVHAPDTIYLLEFKVKSTAEKALQQIESKDYAAQFATDSRKLVKVSVNFDIDTWTIEDWTIAR